MTGKGSAPRPFSVTDEEYKARFDAIDWSDRGQGCGAKLAEGQWWTHCGQTDPQQHVFKPVLCTDCGGKLAKAEQ